MFRFNFIDVIHPLLRKASMEVHLNYLSRKICSYSIQTTVISCMVKY